MKTELTDLEQASLQRKLPVLRFFEYGHLGDKLRPFSKDCCNLAWSMALQGSTWHDGEPTTNAETAAGLRKLLEAKDCFVRAGL